MWCAFRVSCTSRTRGQSVSVYSHAEWTRRASVSALRVSVARHSTAAEHRSSSSIHTWRTWIHVPGSRCAALSSSMVSASILGCIADRGARAKDRARGNLYADASRRTNCAVGSGTNTSCRGSVDRRRMMCDGCCHTLTSCCATIRSRCCRRHGSSCGRRWLRPMGCSAHCIPSRCYTPLPNNQEDFTPYVEIDLPTETRIDCIRRSGLAGQEWVACEKVHGTNFGIYLLHEEQICFAKRSGIMNPNENFFGYHSLYDEFSSHIRIVCELLKQKFSLGGRVGRVVLHGELFGAKYDHPLVPKSSRWCTLPNGKRFPIAGVEIQREPFPQYSPELHFYAFDIKYSLSGAEEDFVLLGYDDFAEVCAKVPGLLYAKALVRGTLDACLAFDVENFTTPLPALLGLGNYPLEGNLAEGVVIRHVHRGDAALEARNVATIIKLRCSSFMELKHPGKQQELKETFIDTVRAGAVQRVQGGRGGGVHVIADSMLPQLECAANRWLLNHVSDGRLSNVLSKLGTEPLVNGSVTARDVTLLLAKDALKDFLKCTEEVVLNMPMTFRKTLIRNAYWEADVLVQQRWQEIIERERRNMQGMSLNRAEEAGSMSTGPAGESLP